ncbi:MAG: hypothetical protein HY904_14945 [Deltaproteobacteria bacterium]|nr:hypothetical protein [Deltaproteobacteria bacterium]
MVQCPQATLGPASIDVSSMGPHATYGWGWVVPKPASFPALMDDGVTFVVDTSTCCEAGSLSCANGTIILDFDYDGSWEQVPCP